MTDVFDADDITGQYLKCRRALAKMGKSYRENVAVIEGEMARLEGLMGDFLEAHKMKSAPSVNGVFYRELKVMPQAVDWTAIYNWIKEKDAFHFLHKRISSDAVKTYMEEHKDDEDGGLPPGMTVMKEYKVTVRTGKDKDKE